MLHFGSLSWANSSPASRRRKPTNCSNRTWLGTLFRHDDWIGATTLVKRVWHLAYLANGPWHLPVRTRKFPMSNTHDLAQHRPNTDSAEKPDPKSASEGGDYFAVLAFDGDSMGQWVSGNLAPKLKTQLAQYTDGSGNPEGALPYFQKHLSSLSEVRRPVSPGYHLQFSEALANFANKCVLSIIEAYDGAGRPIPFLTPGPAADASAGIAAERDDDAPSIPRQQIASVIKLCQTVAFTQRIKP